MRSLFIILFFSTLKSFAQDLSTGEEMISYLNSKFLYCKSYRADLYFRQNALVEIKSIKIVNDRLRIVESKLFAGWMNDDDTISKEIYIPFKSIKKIKIVYDEFENQPTDGLLDIMYVGNKSRKNKHNYLYFNWDAEKDLKDKIINTLVKLVELNQEKLSQSQ